MGATIGFRFYQSCGNKGSVGRVSVFGLRLLVTCVTCGCSAASNWQPGPHEVSTIVKCLQSPGCC